MNKNVKAIIVISIILVVVAAAYLIYRKIAIAIPSDAQVVADAAGVSSADLKNVGADYLKSRADAIKAKASTFTCCGDNKTYCTSNGRVVTGANPCA